MNQTRARRRVPDQLRKRVAVSCDFCKIRRRKCIRVSAQNACKLCLEHQVECLSTIPRKPRNQVPDDGAGSETTHYQALKDLVSKTFPDVNVDDTESLVRLTQEIDGRNALSPHDHASPVNGRHRTTSISNSRSALNTTMNEPHNATDTDDNELHLAGNEAQAPPNASFYERLLLNPSGTLSYFGSASSMAYVRKMRELLVVAANEQPGLASIQHLRRSFIKDQSARTMGEEQGAVPELPAIDYIQLCGPETSEQPDARLFKFRESLPPKEDIDELIESFFAHVHINVALFHRSSFQTALDRLRSPIAREYQVGWAVCIRLAIAFGCEWRLSMSKDDSLSDRERLIKVRSQLVNDAFSEIPQLILSGTLQSVTALTLLSVYMTFANERNAAYILSSCAIRMAVGLGLHRGENILHRSDIYLNPLEKELRKEIWCSLYIFEQYTSAILGRPSAVDGPSITVDIPKESVLDLGFYWPPGYLRHDVLLARIVGKVRNTQVNQSLTLSNDFQGLPDIERCHTLLQELEAWRKDLPAFLEFEEAKIGDVYPSHLRQILMLHVRYQYARIMLCRPFLLKALYVSHGHNGTVSADQQVLMFKDVCFQAALDCWTLIHCLWKAGEYNAHLWLDGVFAYQCNLILSLYLLDTSETSIPSQPRKIYQMVKQIQEILHKEPGNRTMRRLVQISRDFSEIVSATSPNLGQEQEADNTNICAPTGSNQCHQANSSTTFADIFSTIPHVQDFDPAVINWENMMMSDILHGDPMGERFLFDPLANFPI